MKKIQIAIADDHTLLRTEIANLLNAEHDLEVVLQAENGFDLIEKLQSVSPDVILMDINMPKMDGKETTRILSLDRPELKVIAFTQFDFDRNIIEMNRLGVKSFIGKDCEPDELLRAIRVVHSGGTYMTSKATEIIQKELRMANGGARKCPVQLSGIEIQVLKKILNGYSSTEIASEINKSHRTVEKYRNDLYSKIGVTSKTELIKTCLGWGIG